jgi:putative transposase
MLKAYKYELLPTAEQSNRINQIAGSCRFVYNIALETKIYAYQSKKKSISCFELIKQLTELKKDEKTKWLNDAPAQSLQQAISNLDTAFSNFFRGKANFPKFKKKKHKQSFRIPQGIKVDFENWKVFIPKLKWVEFCRDRKFNGEIRQATITKTPTNRYFISILVDNKKELPKKKPIKEKTAIGIDVGLKHFATLSNGTKIENPKYLFHSLKRLRIEQRSLQRKYKKGKKFEEQSNSYKKQKLVVARLHEKISNQRKDFLHKLSSAIVKQYDTICVENLNIKGMIQNKNLSRSILDVGWGMFISQLKYKSEWYGKNFVQIGRFIPSSRLCSCGYCNSELSLADREWTCPECKQTHNRDILAANNIKNFGLRTKPLLGNVVY